MKRTLITYTAFALFAVFASTTHADSKTDSYGNTALMSAAAIGDASTVQQLIDGGAEVNARSDIGNTALIYAAQEGHIEVVEVLIRAGAAAGLANDYNATAPKLALGYGHDEILKILKTAPTQSSYNLIAASF